MVTPPVEWYSHNSLLRNGRYVPLTAVERDRTCANAIGGGAYWAGRAVALPLFSPCGQSLFFARPLFVVENLFCRNPGFSCSNVSFASFCISFAKCSIFSSANPTKMLLLELLFWP